jgi:hypothetical protein
VPEEDRGMTAAWLLFWGLLFAGAVVAGGWLVDELAERLAVLFV